MAYMRNGIQVYETFDHHTNQRTDISLFMGASKLLEIREDRIYIAKKLFPAKEDSIPIPDALLKSYNSQIEEGNKNIIMFAYGLDYIHLGSKHLGIKKGARIINGQL